MRATPDEKENGNKFRNFPSEASSCDFALHFSKVDRFIVHNNHLCRPPTGDDLLLDVLLIVIHGGHCGGLFSALLFYFQLTALVGKSVAKIYFTAQQLVVKILFSHCPPFISHCGTINVLNSVAILSLHSSRSSGRDKEKVPNGKFQWQERADEKLWIFLAKFSSMIFRVYATSRPRHSKLLTKEAGTKFNIIFLSI